MVALAGGQKMDWVKSDWLLMLQVCAKLEPYQPSINRVGNVHPNPKLTDKARVSLGSRRRVVFLELRRNN